MSKHELRKHISSVLRGLSCATKIAQSEAIFEKLINHCQYKKARRISIYLSTENEVDTRPIVKYSLEVAGKQCYIPYVMKKVVKGYETRMVMVALESMKEYDELPVNHYGIKEPKQIEDIDSSSMAKPNDDKNDLDLVIVPGVAFSRDGNRLGHGKGYYDEFLSFWSRTRSNGPPYSIGLAFSEQLVDDTLASQTHDYTLNEVMSSIQL